MKKSLLLAVASFLLPSTWCSAQDLFTPPLPTVIGPTVIEEGPIGAPFGEPYGPLMANSVERQAPRFWARGEFLLLWTRNAPVNTPLVTRALDPTDPTAGAIGSANTAVEMGGQNYGLGTRYGGRFTIGGWFDCGNTVGMEGVFLFISPRSTTQTVSSDGTPGSSTLALPFRDAFSGKEVSVPLAGPGAFGAFDGAGSATLRISNQLQSGELNILGRLWRNDCWNLTGMVGFRYIRFKEDLDFSGDVQVVNAPIPTTFGFHDSFQATNNFYGGQLGLRAEYRSGNFFIEATAKIALGSMNQNMNIAGSALDNNFGNPGTTTSNTGGFYALSSNIGDHSRNVFAVAPEADIKVGYCLTRNIQAFAGYNFLYINNVARPGTSIDHTINITQSPGFGGSPATLTGPGSPSFSFNRSDFWAQGMSFGLQFRY